MTACLCAYESRCLILHVPGAILESWIAVPLNSAPTPVNTARCALIAEFAAITSVDSTQVESGTLVTKELTP
jgi:hypothetical protein